MFVLIVNLKYLPTVLTIDKQAKTEVFYRNKERMTIFIISADLYPKLFRLKTLFWEGLLAKLTKSLNVLR